MVVKVWFSVSLSATYLRTVGESRNLVRKWGGRET